MRDILLSGEVIELKGDVQDEAGFDCLWIMLTAAKWRLPRMNPHIPYCPDKPLPISRTGPEFVNPTDRVR